MPQKPPLRKSLPPPRKPLPPDSTASRKQKTEAQEAEDLDIAIALSASLAQQTISDLPFDEWPLTEPYECITCCETLSPSLFPTRRITSTCDHSKSDEVLRRICKTCLARHLDVQLERSGPNGLTCPICLAALTHDDVKQWASPQTFARYDELRTRHAVSSDPDFVWCCNPECGAGQMHTSGSASPIVTCHICRSRTCFNHHGAWHEGLTCTEFDHPEVAEERRRQENAEIEAIARQQEEIARDRRAQEAAAQIRQRRQEEQEKERIARARHAEQARRRNEERLGETEVMKTSKPCPGPQCSYRVYKIDGCRHMTCKLPCALPELVYPSRAEINADFIFKAHTVTLSGVGFVGGLGGWVIWIIVVEGSVSSFHYIANALSWNEVSNLSTLGCLCNHL
jgi:hypothetical protein